MRNKVDSTDLEIARIAARQHGLATSRQLGAAGLSRAAIQRRSRKGRLHRVHRGVYAVGHPPLGIESRWMAAVLASGGGALLSHASAAALWSLLRLIPGPIDVSVPTYAGRSLRPGIRLHRRDPAGLGHPVSRRGIPVTTPAQTIADIDGVLPAWLVRRATRQAELAGYALGPEIKSDRTRSDLERDFLRLCRRHRIPPPEVNVRVGRRTIDFLWRRERVAVETDFHGYHRGRVAFRDDRARDLDCGRPSASPRRVAACPTLHSSS